MGECIRYSEAFKLQVVRELEEGKHANCWAAREAYGIRGAATVQYWLRKYGRAHLLRKVVRVQTPDERSELRKAKDRIAALEKALVEAHLDLRLQHSYLELACELGWQGSVEELKKKRDGMPSTEPCRRASGKRA
jgi:transposase-like protein